MTCKEVVLSETTSAMFVFNIEAFTCIIYCRDFDQDDFQVRHRLV